MDDKVSVILPVKNANEFFNRAVKSILNQTYKNIELIVIENGSKGNVEDFLNLINLEKGQEIKYFYSDIANVSKARNIGIENSKGKYLAFIDSDDFYEKYFLEKMVKKIENFNLQLVSCGYKTIISKENKLLLDDKKVKETTDLKFYLENLKENYLFNELWNKLYLNNIVQENNIKFNEEFDLGEDFIFNLDYLEKINRAGFINEILYSYTDSQNGLNLKYRDNKFEIEYKLTKYLEDYYKRKNYSMDYIYNRYARVYYNGIINIYSKDNFKSKKEKDKQLSDFIESEKYIKDLNFLKDKIIDKKFKFAVNFFFLRGKFLIKIFIFLNNLRKI